MITLLLALGCTKDDGSIAVDSGVEADADTDADSDTDTDTDADADTDSDTDTDVEYNESVTFVLDGDWENTGLAFTFAEIGDAGINGGETDSGTVVTASTQLVTPDRPTGDELQEVEDAPGMFISLHVVDWHADPDGNGDWDEGDTILGTSDAYLTWIEGDMPSEFEFLGFQLGWNALVFEEGSDFPTAIDTDAIPVSPIPHNDSVTIGGSSDYTDKVTLLPFTMFEGGTVEELLHDGELEATWELTIEGDPPEDHLVEEETATYALELPLAYADSNESGGPDEGDTLQSAACLDGLVVALMWVAPPATPIDAFLAGFQGLGSGWYAVQFDESEGAPTILDESTAASLSFDGSCTLE